MPSVLDISAGEFANGLTPGRVRTGMIIQAALGIGTLTFFLMVLLIAFTHRSANVDTDSLEFLSTLTIVAMAMFIVLGSVAQLLYRSRFSPSRIESAMAQELRDQQGNPIAATPVEKAIAFIRTSMLLRTALFEGSAFMGLVVLLIAAVSNVLFTTPWLWINAIPAGALLSLIVITFPTSSTMQRIFETDMLRIH